MCKTVWIIVLGLVLVGAGAGALAFGGQTTHGSFSIHPEPNQFNASCNPDWCFSPSLAGSGQFNVSWTNGSSQTNVVLSDWYSSTCRGTAGAVVGDGPTGSLSINVHPGDCLEVGDYGNTTLQLSYRMDAPTSPQLAGYLAIGVGLTVVGVGAAFHYVIHTRVALAEKHLQEGKE